MTTTTSGRSVITMPADRQIHVARVFDAPRDRVWRAFTDPALVAQWWGRGNKLVIERMEAEGGGHWRYVEHAPDGMHGFEGRYREVTPHERIVRTFEWDGMPGHVIVETTTFEDLGDSRTRIVSTSLFHTTEDRDGMPDSGMGGGLTESYAALDRLLATADREGNSIPSPVARAHQPRARDQAPAHHFGEARGTSRDTVLLNALTLKSLRRGSPRACALLIRGSAVQPPLGDFQ